MKAIDLTGQRFGNLIALDRLSKGRVTYWRCICFCGNIKEIGYSNIVYGHTTSCGCLHSAMLVERNFKHGERRTPTYKVWTGMKTRCFNPNSKSYTNYGGRGITICERWLTFENFLNDMGPRPSDGHSIDRINNDGNYEPDNCRWATDSEQMHNRRPYSEWRK